MKTKIKLLTILCSIITTTSFSNLLIQNNNTPSLNYNSKANTISKEFDGKLIGATKGTFTIEYSDVDHCELTKVSKSFSVYLDVFDFNNGRFTSNGITYTITKIGKNAFKGKKHFHNSFLVVPSTIKVISENAFYNCSRSSICYDKEIRGIKFEEGIEEIGKNAFYYCCDIEEKYIKLPNSLKSIWFDSFSSTKVEILDLSALDHVIKINCSAKDKEKKLDVSKIKEIYFRNPQMKNEYANAYCWRKLSSKNFKVSENPNIEEIIIPASSIGAQKGYLKLEATSFDNAIIKRCSDNFSVSGNWNINGGKITYHNSTYTITEIGRDAFEGGKNKNFNKCYLTIPSTIKKIGINAFYENKISGINFEEGVEDIGACAFRNCTSLETREIIKIPNSVKHIGNCAFTYTYIETVDLTALDHVIDIDAGANEASTIIVGGEFDVWVPYGCLTTTKLDKIYVKNEIMKSKYLANKKWKFVKDYIKIK